MYRREKEDTQQHRQQAVAETGIRYRPEKQEADERQMKSAAWTQGAGKDLTETIAWKNESSLRPRQQTFVTENIAEQYATYKNGGKRLYSLRNKNKVTIDSSFWLNNS